MSEWKIRRIAQQFAESDEADAAGVGEWLAEHEEFLQDQSCFKLLAFAYFRAGRIADAHRAINLVPKEDLDSDEMRNAAAIRHQWRQERRMRFGLYLPSDKRLGQRLIDGARNLLRYGRLRDPTTTIPRELRTTSVKIKIARERDVRELLALLSTHEEHYRERDYAKFLAFNFYHAGCLAKAASYIDQVDAEDLSDKEAVLAANIRFEHRALQRMCQGQPPIDVDPAKSPAYASARPYQALYLAASSRPFILSGYTSRSEAIVKELGGGDDFALHAVTRPGFPLDRTDAKNLGESTGENNLFDVIQSKSPYRGDFEMYLAENLPGLENYARDRGVNIVHGVSNYRNGAIGLALARRLAVPFVYEIRGLWEETTDSKLAGWRDTERFEFERSFERFLAHEADGILAINEQVCEVLEITHRTNVNLLPNCVGEATIVDRGLRETKEQVTIGYVGSILEYEGLDDLVHAVSRVREFGHDVRLRIYGKGRDQQRLRDLVRDLGVAEISFEGVVDPRQVPALYAGFDLCVFPRKPYRVCQLVTPIKPLEAMANDVNVVVSDVAPLVPFSVDGSALSFQAGDVDSLVETIQAFMIMDASERKAMRDKARALLRRSHIWRGHSATVEKTYRFASDAVDPHDASRLASS